MIEKVEDVGAEVQPLRLAEQSYAAADAQVQVHEAGANHAVARRGAETELPEEVRIGVRAGVDPRLHGAGVIGRLAALRNRQMACRIGVGVHRPRAKRIRDQVRPITANDERGEALVARAIDRKWLAALR